MILIFQHPFQHGPELNAVDRIRTEGLSGEAIKERRDAKANRILSRCGMYLMVTGFMFQLISNFVPYGLLEGFLKAITGNH